MLGRLEESLKHFNYLTEQVVQPETLSRTDVYQRISKERAKLEPMVVAYQTYVQKLKNYNDSRELLQQEKDAEMRAMAQEEIGQLEPQLDEELKHLQMLLLPKDPNDEKNTVVEIRAGVGGDEAGIFAGDLYRMYTRFAESKRWRTELLSLSEATSGGFREIIFLIEGEAVYSRMKFETGVHRVQRVPKTEASGRIHTSTATVAVLPEAEEVDIQIHPNDLRTDVFRAGGNGGQSVNTTDSAVRLTHLPTNTVVICQDEKSQIKNKAKAMKVLLTRLYDKASAEQNAAISSARRAQVGTGMRNERIRTYNFPQGRVTDHRIGMTIQNVDAVMGGDVEPFIRALADHYQTLALRGESPDAVRIPTSDDDE
ncbi:MAG: peptide chain release factor 1 [Bdellovibrionota bacterium]